MFCFNFGSSFGTNSSKYTTRPKKAIKTAKTGLLKGIRSNRKEKNIAIIRIAVKARIVPIEKTTFPLGVCVISDKIGILVNVSSNEAIDLTRKPRSIWVAKGIIKCTL